MSVRQAIASLLQLFVVFAFFSAGLFFICLAYLPQTRILVENFLINHYSAFAQIGWGFFIASFTLLMGFYGLSRGRYLRIKMGKNLAEIDAGVIRQTIEEHFKNRFANEIHLIDVEIVRGSQINIGVAITRLSDDSSEEFLGQVENELIPLLRNRFGYSKHFHLHVKI